jgi:FHA domain-containing protein
LEPDSPPSELVLGTAGGTEAPPDSDSPELGPVAHAARTADLAPNSEGDVAAEGPRILVGFLVSYETVDIGQYWPIHQGRNVLGRQGAATGLDVEVAHPTISSLHAVLLASAQPARVVLEDTNSTNGTFLNEAPLAPGQRCELRDGDRVRFGLFNTIIKVIQP